MAHFNRERIPKHVVHSKGSGAPGHFACTNPDKPKRTTAKLFEQVGKTAPLFIRFSTAGGEKGSADSERDPRGFSVKFYTEESNWDMLGKNTPIFFIKDPLKLGDFIHTQKRDPETNLKSPTMMWDFFSLSPESLHQVTILFSDRGTPYGYRHMNGYSRHAFSLINAEHELFTSNDISRPNKESRALRAKTLMRCAVKILTAHRAISSKRSRTVTSPGGAFACRSCRKPTRKPITLTHSTSRRSGRKGDCPLIEIGEVLYRNPENYFAEVEQAAFEPRNIVPGMGYSPDKMLHGLIFVS
jgi:catalase